MKVTTFNDKEGDSDVSLQLSEGSSLSSDSDLPSKKKKTTKKKKKKKKKVEQYCTCRRGYDGEEFMIECDGCQEWFHGTCVGLKPSTVIDPYFCVTCLSTAKKKPAPLAEKQKKITITVKKQEDPVPPVISKLSLEDEDEDLDDICPLCDDVCTCGPVNDAPPPVFVQSPPPPPPKPVVEEKKKPELPKLVIKKASKSKKPKKSISLLKQNVAPVISSSSENSSSEEEEEELPKRKGKSKALLVRQKGLPKKGKRVNLMKKEVSSSSSSSEFEEDEELIIDDLDDLLETMSPLSDTGNNAVEESSVLESDEEFFTDDDESLIQSPFTSSHIDSGDDQDIENAETQAIINDMDNHSSSSDESDLFIEDEDDDEDDQQQGLSYYVQSNDWSTDEDEDEEQEEFDYTTSLHIQDIDYITDDDDDDEDDEQLLPLLDSEGNLYDSIAAAFLQALIPVSEVATGANTPSQGEQYQLSAFELAHALTALNNERRPSLPSSTVSAAQRNRSIDFTSETLCSLDQLNQLEPIHEEESPSSNTIQEQLLDILASNPAITTPLIDEPDKQILPKQDFKRKSIDHSLETSKKQKTEDVTEDVSMDDLVDTSLYSTEEQPEEDYSSDLSRWQRIPIGAFRLMRSKNKLWLER